MGDADVTQAGPPAGGLWRSGGAVVECAAERMGRAEVVHVHGLLNPISSGAARAAINRGVPVVIGPFGTMSRYTFAHRRTVAKRMYFRAVDAPNLRRAAGLHFTTPAEREEAKWHGIDFGTRAHVVPPPYRGARASDHRPAATASPLVLFLGRLHPVKGVDVLLDAWPAIRATHPGARLTIAGQGTPQYEAELRSRAARLGADAASVVFPGFVRGADKVAHLAAAQVCVLPSLHENFGISVLDSVAAGVPIIVTPGVQLAAVGWAAGGRRGGRAFGRGGGGRRGARARRRGAPRTGRALRRGSRGSGFRAAGRRTGTAGDVRCGAGPGRADGAGRGVTPRRPVHILGINAYHGDVSAVLVRDGVLIAAVEEERFRRIKHCAGFPTLAIQAVLSQGAIRGGDIDHVAVSRDPKAHLLRKAWYTITHRPDAALVRDRLRNRQRVGDLRGPLATALGVREDDLPRVHHVEHHPSHLASAFFVSPFADAACCAIDGFGDFVSTSFAAGAGTHIDVLDHVFFPHSLGILYTAVTQYLGFPSFGDEFKVMGLAPYGQPSMADDIRRWSRCGRAGSSSWTSGTSAIGPMASRWSGRTGTRRSGRCTRRRLDEILGPARKADEPLTKRHEDIARSLQAVYEECAMHVLRGLWDRTHNPRLCMAGGCAMNSVANGKIREQTPFREVYIQPASGDNGTALGAAYHVWHEVLHGPRGFVMAHGYWGPRHSADEIASTVAAHAPESERPPGGSARVSRRSGAHSPRGSSPMASSSAGIRAGWNGARGRSATAASWPTPGGPTFATSSTRRSSSARSFVPLPRPSRSRRWTITSPVPCRIRS